MAPEKAPAATAKPPAPGPDDPAPEPAGADPGGPDEQAPTPVADEYEATRPFLGYHESQLLKLAPGDRVPGHVGATLRAQGAPLRPVQEGAKERS